MKLLHTSDWHLGRLFHRIHLTDDQAYVLEQFVELAAEVRPDAVLIAGDIYDRAVPPPEAVELLDHTLSRLVRDLRLPVILIAGNHDSPDRVGFGARVFADSRLHVVGRFTPGIAPVILHDEHGPVHIYPVPYAEPAVVRERLEDRTLETHALALRAVLDRIRAAHPRGARSVLVAHAYVSGGTESESERPLSIGGADRVDLDSLAGFDYVALGHLHRPQNLSPNVSYSGSLMKYSFSEAAGTRSANLVTLSREGPPHIERVQLTPRREVRSVQGALADLLAGAAAGGNKDDYLHVRLTDRGPLLDAMGRLREVYPNVLHLDRAVFELDGARAPRPDARRVGELETFGDFFQQITGTALTDPERDAVAQVLEDAARREREAGA